MQNKHSHSTKLLELNEIGVRFGKVEVLKGVTLSLQAGETLALLGANGAGKSTLMNVLSGKIHHYTGEIRLNGKLARFQSPLCSLRHGIGMVQQDLGLIPDLTGAENIMLGNEITRLSLYDRKANLARAKQVLKKLSAKVPLECPVAELSPSKQQLISIARALVTTPKILILDEPTSMITAADVKHLMKVIGELQKQGVAIIFISHKLNEVYESCDRVAVIREGRVVGNQSLAEVEEEKIITWMVGAAPSESQRQPVVRSKPARERCLLKAQHLSNSSIEDICLEINEGEIVGLIGLVGSGRSEILKALAGIDKVHQGTLSVSGKPVPLGSPRESLNAGILLVPEDRARQGLFVEKGLGFNAFIYHPSRYSKWGFFASNAEARAFEEAQSKNKAKADSPWQKARTLSGGNQQRLMLGKTLLRNPSVLLLDEITAGVDISTRRECFLRIEQLAAEGLGVIYTSSQWDEVTDIADRVYVIAEGKIVSTHKQGEASHGDFMKQIWESSSHSEQSREGLYG